MNTLTTFVNLQNKAFADGDVPEAQQILTQLENHLEKRRSWDWLRKNEVENYKQLYRKLRDMSQLLSPSGKATMQQLIRAFQWCEEHGISLSFLDVSANLHKYREATAYLIQVIKKETSDDEIKREILYVIRRIKSDVNRDQTRSWTRTKRAV